MELITYDNIFHLAKKAGFKKIRVKRETWGKSYAIIDRVEYKSANYGYAYGCAYYSNGNIVSGEIGCAGCYQWCTLEILDEDMEVEYKYQVSTAEKK